MPSRGEEAFLCAGCDVLTLVRGTGYNPGSSSLCRKEDSSCQFLEEMWAILYQPSPMSLFENSPASLQSYQEARVEPELHLCCAKGLGQGVLSLERAALCLDTARHTFGCCALTRGSKTAPGAAQLSLEGVSGSPALLWHCPRTLVSLHRLCTKHCAVKKLLG